MKQPRALVIGSGPGGLTAAAALHRRGWSVTVLERVASLAPAGAAISLAANAQRALDAVGVGDAVRALAAWEGSRGLRTPGGRWLSRTDAAAVAERFGGGIALVHRAGLAELLAARLPDGALRTGARAEVVDPGGPDRPALVGVPDGALEAELVVAADGIASAARRVLFPGHPGPAYAGFTTWRLVLPGRPAAFEPHETWGRGQLWGSQPLADGRVYAYATAAVPEGRHAPDGELAELRRRFAGWHDPIPAVLAAAEPGQVLHHDVHWLAEPLPAFHRGRVALLGDAAHAMTPNLGQGGNQAIEDGVVLAHHAAADPAAVPDALERYTRDRLPRTRTVALRSARAGRLIHLTGPFAVRTRNTLVRAGGLLAPRLVLRGLDGIADWRPPPGDGADPGGPYASPAQTAP
ncbi:FAD-dependent monooxygenase [Streptomyces sp. MAR4 CNX-425]|uniref:FAD-dependent monooxygenase n=1 Tax=Streptomyces sp. MAR4 CNX-425 TaxID=3406343 RepID=UPI003B5047B0